MMMSLGAFTALHVALSLIAIASGFVVLFGMIVANKQSGVTVLFLVTTILTSVTGFMFPYKGFTPGIGIGVLSLIVLLVALVARYVFRLRGRSRGVWVVTASLALYFNFFVLIVQSFEKIPALHKLAPTQTEGPFKIAQLISLVLFAILTGLAFYRFRLQPKQPLANPSSARSTTIT
jgi:hypothetical protein